MFHHQEMAPAPWKTAPAQRSVPPASPNLLRALLPAVALLGVAAALLLFPEWVDVGGAALGRHPFTADPSLPGATISWWRSLASIETLVGLGFVRWTWWLSDAAHFTPGPDKARLFPGVPLWLSRNQVSAHWTLLLVLGFIVLGTEGGLHLVRWLLH